MKAICTIMKKSIYLSLLVAMTVLLSCKKTTTIGGNFVFGLTNQPVAGLEIGLYQWKDSLTYLTTWQDIELKASTTTDSNGYFFFDMTQEEPIGGYMYLPLQPNDSLSVNAKYKVKDYYSYTADWGTSQTFFVKPSVNVKIHFLNGQPMDSITIECNDIIGYHIFDGSPSMIIFPLCPGKSYDFIISIYKNGEKVSNEVQSFYINYNQNTKETDLIDKTDFLELTVRLKE